MTSVTLLQSDVSVQLYSTIGCKKNGNIKVLKGLTSKAFHFMVKKFEKVLFEFSIWLIVTFESPQILPSDA